MKTDITLRDNTSTIAIARLMSEFNGLFTQKNIQKLIKNRICQEDLSGDKLEWYHLWGNETFSDWLEIISNNNVIQYDNFEDSIIYFVDLKLNNCS